SRSGPGEKDVLCRLSLSTASGHHVAVPCHWTAATGHQRIMGTKLRKLERGETPHLLPPRQWKGLVPLLLCLSTARQKRKSPVLHPCHL
ncbi:hypothetical protein LEMLEM_LOCUS2167, partial [Lemmus lemmus]